MTVPELPPRSSDDGNSHEPAEDALGGHTVEELSDYLDRGCTPPDPSIDDSPECQIVLESLQRLRAVSLNLFEEDVKVESERGFSWVGSILDNIAVDARAGRDIPVHHPSPSAHLVMSEGAVRGLIRAAGDSVGGVLIGSCKLEGDVTVPRASVVVTVEASVLWGERIADAADRIRGAIYSELMKHTELQVEAIHVEIHDVLIARTRPTTELETP
ncbi:MAG TPA: hypothetical protein VGP24_08640 [Glaciihabitans sp.]|nr:hypothetical protein [Glaciihabitans sp.]